MSSRNTIHKKDSAETKNIKFCTECGEELENFSIEGHDLEMIKRKFHHCKTSGKFKGDVCSKLFILNQNDDDPDDQLFF